MEDYQDWLMLCQRLNRSSRALAIELLETGRKAYLIQGRGAIKLTLYPPMPTFCFMERALWVEALEDNRRKQAIEVIDRYDPEQQVALITVEPTPDSARVWIKIMLIKPYLL